MKIAESKIYNWYKSDERKHIYSIFRVMVRAAINRLKPSPVPTTSPGEETEIPIQYFKRISLAKYRSPKWIENGKHFSREVDSPVGSK